MAQITSTLLPQSSPSEWEERDISEALTGFSRHFPEFSWPVFIITLSTRYFLLLHLRKWRAERLRN